MEQPSIRRAVATDVPAITELWKALMDFHAVRERYFARAQGGETHFAEFLGECVSKAESGVFVADARGVLVGYCLVVEVERPPVFVVTHTVEVLDLAVTEKWRRSGVGEQLVRKALAWAASRSAAGVEVKVATSNDQALAFWRRLGGRPVMEIIRLEGGYESSTKR
jgi:ribosomal protein S18 acetylase RimI-like enzyme